MVFFCQGSLHSKLELFQEILSGEAEGSFPGLSDAGLWVGIFLYVLTPGFSIILGVGWEEVMT